MDITTVGSWLWSSFGKELAEKALGTVKEQLERFQWDEAAGKYRNRARSLHSTMRVLGSSKPIPLEGIYTDVYILDKPTAFRRYSIEQLQTSQEEHGTLTGQQKRTNALRLVTQEDKLFVLGKPGAGKTTFLKYLTIKAAEGKLDKVPIYISLHEWANSNLKLMSYIVRQFEICAFPDAQSFVEKLLQKGSFLVAFDGLDEVNLENNQRAEITQVLTEFTNQYPGNKFIITCRIAATDYTFEKFTYVEIADFDAEQVKVFVTKWFSEYPSKATRFFSELEKVEHRGLRELAQTPLLLTLLCLGYEETLSFPERRAEVYEEAVDALLKRWDASRNIKRDDSYHSLSLGRKRQLFMHLAAGYFERGEMFFRQDDLGKQIASYLKRLPSVEPEDVVDSESIIKAIEAQHGIFVERAHRVFSFSHLTLQEYFTARYIVDNSADGTLSRLVELHLTDTRWHEVMLLTASMLSDATAHMKNLQNACWRLISSDAEGVLVDLANWTNRNAKTVYPDVTHPTVARALLLNLLRNMRFDRVEFSVRITDMELNARTSFDYFDLIHILGYKVPPLAQIDLDLALAHAIGDEYKAALVYLESLASTYVKMLRKGDVPSPKDQLAVDVDEEELLLRFKQRLVSIVGAAIQNCIDTSKVLGKTRLLENLSALRVPDSFDDRNAWEDLAWGVKEILVRFRGINNKWTLSKWQRDALRKHQRASVLFAECLRIAAVSGREEFEQTIMAPINTT